MGADTCECNVGVFRGHKVVQMGMWWCENFGAEIKVK